MKQYENFEQLVALFFVSVPKKTPGDWIDEVVQMFSPPDAVTKATIEELELVLKLNDEQVMSAWEDANPVLKFQTPNEVREFLEMTLRALKGI